MAWTFTWNSIYFSWVAIWQFLKGLHLRQHKWSVILLLIPGAKPFHHSPAVLSLLPRYPNKVMCTESCICEAISQSHVYSECLLHERKQNKGMKLSWDPVELYIILRQRAYYSINKTTWYHMGEATRIKVLSKFTLPFYYHWGDVSISKTGVDEYAKSISVSRGKTMEK